MATIQLTIPDTLLPELDSIARSQGYASLHDLVKGSLRSLLLRQRLEQAEPGVRTQVERELS